MIEDYTPDELDQVCPHCGNVIEDINSYCPHCIKKQEMERKILLLIQTDPQLSRMADICNTLTTCFKLLVTMFFIALILRVFILYTGLLSHLFSFVTLAIPACAALAILCGGLYIYMNRKLIRLSEKKIRRLERHEL